MESRASHSLKQSLLSKDERIEAGHINPTVIEDFSEEKKIETPGNKINCDLSCTRTILSCLSIYKEICMGDSFLNDEEDQPSPSANNFCDRTIACCCDHCLLCIGGSSLALIGCITVPLAFFADGIRILLKAGTNCLAKEPESEPAYKTFNKISL